MGRAVGSGPATLLLPSTSHRGWCCLFPALPCLPCALASHGHRLVPGSPGGEDGVRRQLGVWDLGGGAGGARALTYMPTGPCGPSAPGFPGRPCRERQELSPLCSRAGSAGGLGWADPTGGSRLSTWECIPGVCILLFAPLPGCQPALSNACPPPSVPAGDLGLNFMPSRGGSSSDAPAPCSHPWCPPPGLSNHPNPPHISPESLRDVHHPGMPQAAPRTPTPPWALTFGPREPGSPSGPGFPWGPFIFKGNVQGGGGCNETSPTEALLVLLCSAVSGANPACPGSSHQHRRTVTMQGDKTRGVLLLGCPPNLGECPPRGARPAAGAALAAGRVLVSTPATWAKAGGCSPSPCTSNSHPRRWRWSKRFGPLWSPGPCPPGGKGVPRAALPHKDHLWLGKAAESSESSMQTESLGRLSCSSLFAAVSAAEDFFFF